MPKITRRNMLKSGAVLAAGITAWTGTGIRKSEAVDRAGTKYNWGHTMDFGEQYFVRMVEIIERIRLTEMNLLGDITSRMAETLKKGGNVWLQAHSGHMGPVEFREENKGNPKILRSRAELGSGDYDRMKPGDVLVTNFVSEEVQSLRDSGVYVVGVPVNYIDNEWAPRGFVQPNVNDWLLGDVSNVILQSYIPYTQGIVDCPEIPALLHLSSEVAYNDGLLGRVHDWSYATFGVSTKVHINKNMAFVPGLYHQLSMDDSIAKRDVTYAMLSMKYRF